MKRVLLVCALCFSVLIAQASDKYTSQTDKFQRLRIQAKKELTYDVRAINKFIANDDSETDDVQMERFYIEGRFLICHICWVSDRHLIVCDKDESLDLCYRFVDYADPDLTILVNAFQAQYGLKIVNESAQSKRTKTFVYTNKDIMGLLPRCYWR